MNKYLKVIILWLSLSLGITVIFLGLFVYKEGLNEIPNIKSVINFFIFVSVIVLLSILIYALFKLPMQLRLIKMKKLAKKFKLEFIEDSHLFKLDQPTNKKYNIMMGNINNHSIEIYDYIDTRKQWVPFGGPAGGFISKKETVIVIDGKEEKIRGFINMAPISKIKEKLAEL